MVVVLVIGLAGFLYLNRPAVREGPFEESPEIVKNLPQLIDLGADKCVPCKMMAPILEELGVTFASSFTVEFIDVWKHPEAAEPYGIKLIPTQLFLSPDGEELFRHEGFFSREDILAKWNELGVDTGTI